MFHNVIPVFHNFSWCFMIVSHNVFWLPMGQLSIVTSVTTQSPIIALAITLQYWSHAKLSPNWSLNNSVPRKEFPNRPLPQPWKNNWFVTEVTIWWSSTGNQQLKITPQFLAPCRSLWHLEKGVVPCTHKSSNLIVLTAYSSFPHPKHHQLSINVNNTKQ